MKTLIAILLIIPSLSWGKDIKLSCDYVDEMINEDGDTSFNFIFKNPHIFIFNSNDKSLIRYYDYGNKEYYLDNEKSNENIFFFRYENISMNIIFSETLELNRFTLDISGGTFKDSKLKTIYTMKCKVIN